MISLLHSELLASNVKMYMATHEEKLQYIQYNVDPVLFSHILFFTVSMAHAAKVCRVFQGVRSYFHN